MKQLGARLALICLLVREGAVAADIGCDHGFAAAQLIVSGRAHRVYACDNKPRPLARAQALARRLGIEDRMLTVLTNGLTGLPLDDITDVIVAGMGGDEIVRILEPAHGIRDVSKRLILQPMTKEGRLRAFLYKNGFEIVCETPVRDAGRVYTVLQAAYTGCVQRPSPADIQFGALRFDSSDDAHAYIERVRRRLEARVAGLGRAGRFDEQRRIQALLDSADSESKDSEERT